MDPSSLPLPSLDSTFRIRIVIYTKIEATDRLRDRFGEPFLTRILARPEPFVYPIVRRF